MFSLFIEVLMSQVFVLKGNEEELLALKNQLHFMNTGQVIEHLLEINRSYEVMEKECSEGLEKQLKEEIVNSKKDLLDELRKLEDLAERLRIEIEETKTLQQPFDPELFSIFKKVSKEIRNGDLNKTLIALLIGEYSIDEKFFKAKYQVIYDKYKGETRTL